MRREAAESRPHVVVGVDLFAGAGGFSLAALEAGIAVVAAVEHDNLACETYRENLITSGRTRTRLYEGDIEAIEPAGVHRDCALDRSGCDILIGGPPCQGFSTHRIKGAGIGDPRNELLLRYFEFVRFLRPLFFLVENVPGLLWPRHKSFLDDFYQLAEEAGYDLLPPVVLNARDFGVPQNRRRVFILGRDKRRCVAMPAWPPSRTHSDDETDGLPNWLSASTAFAKRPDDGDVNNVHMNHGAELVETFRRTPPNGGSRAQSGRTLACHKVHQGHSDVYGRIDPTKPAPTMTTACINPSKGRFVHPTLHHGITLREAARLQSFPDWFVFRGGLMAGGVQVGNAVPVTMGVALLRPLRKAAAAIKAVEAKRQDERNVRAQRWRSIARPWLARRR